MTKKERSFSEEEFKKYGFSQSLIEDGSILPFFKKLIDSIPHLLLVVRADENLSITAVNEFFSKSVGISEKDMIDLPVEKIFKDQSIVKHRKQYADTALKNKTSVYWLDERDKKIFSNSIFPIVDSDGSAPYLVMMARDITKQKEEEEMRLKAKEQYFLSLIEFSNDIFTVVDSKGTIKFSSSSLRRILGNVPDKRRNQNIFENIHPEDKDEAIRFFKRVLKDPSCHENFVYRIKDVWGNYRYLESSVSNQLKNPAFNGIIINSRDVTQREEDKAEIYKQKTYLEDMVNGVNEIVFTVDSENKIVLWNSTAEHISHYGSRQILGKSLKKLDVFENATTLVEFLEKKRTGKNPTLQDIIIVTRKGEKRLWKSSVSFLKANNKKTDAIFICKDITFSQQIHSKLIPGSSYIVFDKNIEMSLKIFLGLLNDDRAGLFISRDTTNIDEQLIEPSKVRLLIEKERGENTISSLQNLYETVTEFVTESKKTMVLIDRLDYFIIRFSFEKTLQMLYRLNAVIQKNNSLLLLRINPDVLSIAQQGFLQEEFLLLPAKSSEDIVLDKEVFDVLLFIDSQNKTGDKVAQKDVCENFGISKVTAQKRLDELRLMHLVSVKKEGRFKYLRVTDQGLSLIYEREAL